MELFVFVSSVAVAGDVCMALICKVESISISDGIFFLFEKAPFLEHSQVLIV